MSDDIYFDLAFIGMMDFEIFYGKIIANANKEKEMFQILKKINAIRYIFITIIFLNITSYEITGLFLTVRFGTARRRIKLEAIVEAAPTSAVGYFLAALSLHHAKFALSANAILVKYQREDGTSCTMVISPRDKSGFLADLGNAADLRDTGGGKLCRELESAT